MKNNLILEKGDIIELENYATVIEDLGDKIKFFWNTDYPEESWVWKRNIHKVYRNGEVIYGKIYVNKLKVYPL